MVSHRIAAEAAVWVARLHGPSRSSRMERLCLAWQARSAEHQLAFERCTETWLDVPRITLGDAFAIAPPRTVGPSQAFGARRWAMALSLVGLALVASVKPWRGNTAYRTGVGEQQLVVLDDGTRMSLNTATRVRVDLGSYRRTVDVEAGEALFEVAKDPHRPFVVRAAGSEVVALGTVFSVRLTAQARGSNAVAVTLIEGKVSVHRQAERGSHADPLMLQPGERARLEPAAGAAPRVDRPRIDQLVAWKRGEVLFDDASLAEAVAELNRYSRTPIVLVGPAASSGLRVSGQFHTGDNAGFARAVAKLHGLAAQELQDRVELRQGSQSLDGQPTASTSTSVGRPVPSVSAEPLVPAGTNTGLQPA